MVWLFFALIPHCRICLVLTRGMMVCMGRDHLVYIAVMAAGPTSSKVCPGAGSQPASASPCLTTSNSNTFDAGYKQCVLLTWIEKRHEYTLYST
jgi:hypothetical protein